MSWFMGIDIGSVTSKGVIAEDDRLVAYHLLPSGVNYGRTVHKLKEELLEMTGLVQEDIAYTMTTGHGGSAIPFGNQHMPDIQCCARGIHGMFPLVRTVINVQGQSSQVIRVNETGQVINFAVSEKCAAGSGHFIEIVANVLQVELEHVGPLSLKSEKPIVFTTGCAVFGESEAVSRVAEGISKEDILAGVHKALGGKISALVHQVGLERLCAISGGGALNVGIIKELEENLGVQLLVPPQPQLVNALGAAIMAGEKSGNRGQ